MNNKVTRFLDKLLQIKHNLTTSPSEALQEKEAELLNCHKALIAEMEENHAFKYAFLKKAEELATCNSNMNILFLAIIEKYGGVHGEIKIEPEFVEIGRERHGNSIVDIEYQDGFIIRALSQQPAEQPTEPVEAEGETTEFLEDDEEENNNS